MPHEHSRSCDGIAVVTYRRDGEVKTWGLGAALCTDTEDTLRAHVARWLPDAEFVSVAFMPAHRPARGEICVN